ncbi:MAG: hypothetical protein HYZ69_03795 [Candidatus Colwellbacteria bacterium]|nr:hypothetical protein [Candidatus Colwellbacteria bacterium]
MHRFLKQFIYGFLYLSILAVIVGGVYYFYFIPEQSCFDNIKNQNEVETDCGGGCAACELKTLKLQSDAPQVFSAGASRSTILIKIKNPSSNYELPSFDYKIGIVSKFGTPLLRLSGTSYVSPKEDKYLVIPGIDIDSRDISTVNFSVDNPLWQEVSGTSPKAIGSKSLKTTITSQNVQIDGIFENNSPSQLSLVQIGAILFNKNGEISNASATALEEVRAFSSRPFTVFFPKIIKNDSGLIDIDSEKSQIFYEIRK